MSDTAVECEISFWAIVQKPHPDGPRRWLASLTTYLSRKFHCHYDERQGLLICKPHDPKHWVNADDFRRYAAEHIIYALSKELNHGWLP